MDFLSNDGGCPCRTVRSGSGCPLSDCGCSQDNSAVVYRKVNLL